MISPSGLPETIEVTQVDIDKAARAHRALARLQRRVLGQPNERLDGQAVRQASRVLLGRT